MMAIPFDFDMCGVIAIPYKSPTVPFKKGEKPERNFLGKDISKDNIIEATDILRSKKNEIIRIFNTSPLLKPDIRKNIVGHLTDFFDLTGDVDRLNMLFELQETDK